MKLAVVLAAMCAASLAAPAEEGPTPTPAEEGPTPAPALDAAELEAAEVSTWLPPPPPPRPARSARSSEEEAEEEEERASFFRELEGVQRAAAGEPDAEYNYVVCFGVFENPMTPRRPLLVSSRVPVEFTAEPDRRKRAAGGYYY